MPEVCNGSESPKRLPNQKFTTMPKISDILGGLRTAEMNECATLIQVANVMRCSVAEVREKFAQYGTGMIYTSGLIMSDTPRHRAKLTDMYGEIIVLFEDGTVYCRTRANTGQINRHKQKKARKREIEMSKREAVARKLEAERLAMFKSCQTQACPKRQGKANSHEDIGKYVSDRGRKCEDLTSRAVDVFVTIHIPGL